MIFDGQDESTRPGLLYFALGMVLLGRSDITWTSLRRRVGCSEHHAINTDDVTLADTA